jgi:hypothetical protein
VWNGSISGYAEATTLNKDKRVNSLPQAIDRGLIKDDASGI